MNGKPKFKIIVPTPDENGNVTVSFEFLERLAQEAGYGLTVDETK